MTDPSRIVFGISPPPHARAPIARALTNDGCSVGMLCPPRLEPGIIYTHARFAHLLLALPPLVACKEQANLMAVDQHKEMRRKKIGLTDCTSS